METKDAFQDIDAFVQQWGDLLFRIEYGRFGLRNQF